MKFNRILTNTHKYIGPSIFIAMVATILGFSALFISPVPMIADFGKMLTIGLVISFLAALIILTSTLFIKDKYFCQDNDTGDCPLPAANDPFAKPLAFLTKKVLTFKIPILLLALAITLFGFLSDGKVGIQTDIEHFMPQDTKELLDIRELRKVMGSTDQVTVVVEGPNILNLKSLTWIDEVSQDIATTFPDVITDVRSVTTIYRDISEEEFSAANVAEFMSTLPEMQKKLIIDDNHQSSVIILNIARLETEPLKTFITDLENYLDAKNPATLNLTVAGSAVIDVEMMTALTSGRAEMTLLGVGMVFIGLLIIYRSFLKAIIPVLPISLIVGWSGGAMFLLGLSYTPLTATMGALIIGIGTEFTIILMERYFQEKENGFSKEEAMIRTVSKIGKPVLASAFTTIGGFSALILSDFLILREFGIITLLNIFFCLISSLIVLPPLIVLLDRNKTTYETLSH